MNDADKKLLELAEKKLLELAESPTCQWDLDRLVIAVPRLITEKEALLTRIEALRAALGDYTGPEWSDNNAARALAADDAAAKEQS